MLTQGAAVAQAGITGTWYRIDWAGGGAYCLALPDRCVVDNKPVKPEPSPVEVSGDKAVGLVRLTAPQHQIVQSLAALWDVAVAQ